MSLFGPLAAVRNGAGKESGPLGPEDYILEHFTSSAGSEIARANSTAGAGGKLDRFLPFSLFSQLFFKCPFSGLVLRDINIWVVLCSLRLEA